VDLVATEEGRGWRQPQRHAKGACEGVIVAVRDGVMEHDIVEERGVAVECCGGVQHLGRRRRCGGA
jgi:hypothetical protein